ncbi:WD domain-containing protein, G-beta repeat-containing protein [Candidatus Kryptonium thompsonii]|uniref:WD domain-containing protein, G-beta repeat-containing protein n=5 Tax=Candidatus Kryptonium thompsonii TaxID=1633631 RepID=A0ABM9UVL7_9BACT|nr:Ig-like domain-containing protein [Candidatus Kryptonium thompsoni]CUS86186.1 WD domain-containing protein, G-beta repeat-containing protein [Candidatus Kryptonium thompsoni]CUS91841.1 WD domain-containing protein, G-beta repeat-containing protein [Candidatus Kryptonium thompsoni]CUT05262.1 WD domain-containing protein, G-beta repeat-containing protein [Candidatus Kryptonium thompsoni]
MTFKIKIFGFLLLFILPYVSFASDKPEVFVQLGHSDRVTSIAFSPDGKTFVSGSADNTLKLWDVSTGKEIRTFRGHSGDVTSVAFSPDGKIIISGSGGLFDNTLKLWDVSTGKEIRTFRGHSDDVTSIAFSPDGKTFVSGSADNTLKLWDVSTGKEIRTFRGHSGGVTSVAFSPDGKTFVSGSDDNTLKLWDVSTGKEIRTFKGNSDRVWSVAFSPDGKMIVSGSHDGTTRLWDIATGKEIAQMVGFTDGEWIVITPEGYFNASPNGAKYLNVRVGNNVYSIDNFFEKFFNPVYVASVLQGKKVEAVVDIRKGILTPPDVSIISPEPNAVFNTDVITVTIRAKDTGGGIDEIRLYHNGKVVGEDKRGIKLASSENEIIKTYTVTLVDSINIFRAVGFSKDRTESNPYEITVRLASPAKDVSLYVFAVGINRYKNPALNLNYAEPDARGIVEFFKVKGKDLFKKVETI